MTTIKIIKATRQVRRVRTDNGPGTSPLPDIISAEGVTATASGWRPPAYKVGGVPADLVVFRATGPEEKTGHAPGLAYPDRGTKYDPAPVGGGFTSAVVATQRGVAVFAVRRPWSAIIQGEAHRWTRADLEAAYRLGLNPLPVIRKHNHNTARYFASASKLAAFLDTESPTGLSTLSAPVLYDTKAAAEKNGAINLRPAVQVFKTLHRPAIEGKVAGYHRVPAHAVPIGSAVWLLVSLGEKGDYGYIAWSD